MALKNPQFKKGDLIYTEMGFPAFVYENQKSKHYISIYAFGWDDEHGSEYPEKASFTDNRKRWFRICEEEYGYKKDYVIKKSKEFNVNL